MNKKDEIESLFNDNFRDAEIPVSKNLWKRITSTIAAKKKKRIIWIWVFAAFSVGTSLLFILSGNKENPNAVRTNISTEEQGEKTTGERATENNNTVPEKLISDSQKTSADINASLTNKEENKSKNKIESVNALHKANSPKVNTSVQKNTKTTTTETINKPVLRIDKRKTRQSAYAGDTTNSGSNKQNIHPELPGKNNNYSNEKGTTAHVSVDKKDKPDTNSSSPANPLLSPENTPAKSTLTITTSKVAVKTDSAQASKVLPAASDTIKPAIEEKQAEQVNSVNEGLLAMPKEDPELTDPKNKLFAGAETGVLIPFVNYSGGTNELNNNMKKDITKTISYNGMLAFGITGKSGLTALVGLGITDFKNNYSGTRKVGQLINDSILIIDTINGNSYKDTSYTVKKNTPYKAQIGYQFISLPVFAEYSLPFKNTRFTLAPSIGVVVNFLLRTQSTWVDPETNAIVHNTKSDFNSLSISFATGLKLVYELNTKCRLYISPSYSFFLGNLYKDSTIMKIAPSNLNVNLGLRYYFK